MIFLLGNDGRFLQPIFRIKQARNWLTAGHAKVVKHHPLTIQLEMDTSAYPDGDKNSKDIYQKTIIPPWFKHQNIFVEGFTYKFREVSSMITLNQLSSKNIVKKLNSVESPVKSEVEDSGYFALMNMNNKNTAAVSSCCETVGFKLLLCDLFFKHDIVGCDLVAKVTNSMMCVGMLATNFQAHIGCKNVHTSCLDRVKKGIAETAKEVGVTVDCVNIDNVDINKEYDMTEAVGFGIGIEPTTHEFIDGSRVSDGDIIIGFKSNGLHTTGYDLADQIFCPQDKTLSEEWRVEQKRRKLTEELQHSGTNLVKELLKPTQVYVEALKMIFEKHLPLPTSIVDIGDGGFLNLLRVKANKVKFNITSFPAIPNIFNLIKRESKMHLDQMFVNFNMGIGMCITVKPEQEKAYLQALKKLSFKSSVIGRVEYSPHKEITIHDEAILWQDWTSQD